jgi:hypothetical protein
MTFQQIKVPANNLSRYSLSMPALNICSSSASFQKCVITLLRAKDMQCLADLTAMLLKDSITGKTRHVKPTIFARVNTVALEYLIYTLPGYVKAIGYRLHRLKVIGVAVYNVNCLRLRDVCAHVSS